MYQHLETYLPLRLEQIQHLEDWRLYVATQHIKYGFVSELVYLLCNPQAGFGGTDGRRDREPRSETAPSHAWTCNHHDYKKAYMLGGLRIGGRLPTVWDITAYGSVPPKQLFGVA